MKIQDTMGNVVATLAIYALSKEEGMHYIIGKNADGEDTRIGDAIYSLFASTKGDLEKLVTFEVREMPDFGTQCNPNNQ